MGDETNAWLRASLARNALNARSEAAFYERFPTDDQGCRDANLALARAHLEAAAVYERHAAMLSGNCPECKGAGRVPVGDMDEAECECVKLREQIHGR